ncbi:hypothetical protein JJB99_22085 [Bradyrhizobium diazoefficiens]|uniref:hypothetical protein n=1 Tax=Bradyrhizobium diazoefficiens TaxID=1355477 RepID=UPI00190D90BC|nr:hypothetical protein [Bradyrhizobium diazoefficiens]QQO12177.1 hypothetical protein JJB99_22085 [Bradyrhizobium diazoefficiens]
MAGDVHRVALCALLDEELSGHEQGSDEDEREHRGRELTGIIHRTSFSVFDPHEERAPTIGSSHAPEINCRFFPIDDCAAYRFNN